jgi:hypothetical protein
MTVVLTVLLAIVAVMFVAVARMDMAATSNIADNKMLDSAVKSIIEVINKELVLDTPGAAVPTQEYYDYPDANNAWLASIEPYNDSGVYKWRQISDVTGYLKDKNFSTQNVNVKPVGLDTTVYVHDYPILSLDNNNNLLEQSADADGDGIADSKWFELKNLRTSKGRPIYAAVRVIDNSGMINIDTAHSFDAGSNDETRIDGSSQMQVNLKGLLKTGDSITTLHNARCGSENPNNWNSYERNVIWQYGIPNGNYLPFDISDELELRYRYCIDSKFTARIEAIASDTTDAFGDPGGLYDGDSGWKLPDWQIRITDPNDPNADRRHLLTTLNLDRIIDPDGERMFNIKTDPCAQFLYNRLAAGIDANYSTVSQGIFDAHLAQFAANVIDRGDDDANVSVVQDSGGNKFYGMERPYIYISEITRNFQKGPAPGDLADPPVEERFVVHRSYAIELYKEFQADEDFESWRLIISGIRDQNGFSSRDIPILPGYFNDRGGKFYVMVFEDDGKLYANLSDTVKFSDTPQDGAKDVDPDIILRWARFFLGYDGSGTPVFSDSYDVYFGTTSPGTFRGNQPGRTFNPPGTLSAGTTYYWQIVGRNGANYRQGPVQSFTTWADDGPNSVKEYIPYNTFILDSSTVISLYRPVQGFSSPGILVDRIEFNEPQLSWFFSESDTDLGIRSFQRDIDLPNRLKRLWDSAGVRRDDANSIGNWNMYWNGPAAANNPIQPWYNHFTNVGDAAMMFVKSTYLEGDPKYQIPQGDPTTTEQNVRFDIDDPTMQNIFKYITVWRPDDPNETRIKGRLNINTAPAFIIRQLPWVGRVNGLDVNIADAIVAYRDKTKAGTIDYSNRRTATGINNVSESNGFGSIGQLLNVINGDSGKKAYNIRYCGIDGSPQYGFPDLHTDWDSRNDGIDDDLEEKELIFARISDLVTVRSDIFTAYILVRIGTDGPQKRVITILDRSGGPQKRYLILSSNGASRTIVSDSNDSVSIRAFQLTPEAR